MSHKHAPGWRGRPVSYGPIEDADWLEPRWLSLLWLWGTAGCVILAAGVGLLALGTWIFGS